MVIIHTNLGLENQRVCAEALKAGFEKHDITAKITADRDLKGDRWDTHVIQGPWYAYHEWVGKPGVLWLNRCFYGCHKTIVSLGWLKPDGSRDFKNKDMQTGKGELPELKPMKTTKRCAIVFGDYNEDASEMFKHSEREHDSSWFRPHPASPNVGPIRRLMCDLSTVFDIGDVAVGNKSTVLVDAAINGLHIDCFDPLHVVHHTNREQWIKDLSWSQWHLNEIANGDAWKHLC